MLIEDWKTILTKAWSVRLIILAALLSGIEVALPIIGQTIEPLDLIPPGTFAILSGLTSAGALIARVMAQPDKSP
jgi:hypothetical protein